MIALAIIPSTSVALVITRSISLGIKNGIAVALGIVLGDLVFVLLAILGLSVIAEALGSFFLIIKVLGGAYLIWLGFSLLNTTSIPSNTAANTFNKPESQRCMMASFLAGFFITLGDIKAIFFYASLFPAFVDLSAITLSDLLMILLVTMITVGGVKIVYAFYARKFVMLSTNVKLENTVKKTAGGFMIGAGSYLIVKT